MNIKIRQAQLEDAQAIVLAERVIAKEPGLFCSEPHELTEAAVISSITACLQDKKGVYLVAELDGRIVGHAFLDPFGVKSLSHIASLNIAVHAGWQRQGIGTLLLDRIIDWANKTGQLEKIQLNVRASNFAAIALYKKMSFQEEGRLKNHVKLHDRYVDDLVMGLNLKTTPIPVSFRELHEIDIAAIAQIFCFPWTTAQATTEKWSRYFDEQKAGTRTAYLIEQNGSLIGYASLLRTSAYPSFRNSHIPEINDVWVLESHRKQGYGRMIVEHLESKAMKEGYQTIGLGVGLYQDYGQAQRLYTELSYQPDGKGITYNSEYVTPGKTYTVDDELLLWLTKELL